MENKLLSQSDIDSMLSSMGGNSAPAPKPPAPKPAAPAKPNPAPAPPAKSATAPAPVVPAKAEPAPVSTPPVEQPLPPGDAATRFNIKKASLRHPEQVEDAVMDSEAITTLTAQNNKLQEKIARLEIKVQKLEQMEKVRSGVVAHVTTQDFQGLNKKVEEMTKSLHDISLKLQGTLGYDIYHQFTCEKCGTKEHVSSVYKCTHCGHETWLGWRSR